VCLQRRGEALRVNISAGEGLQDVLKSNLGPLGTIKMYAAFFALDALLVAKLTGGDAGWWTELARYGSGGGLRRRLPTDDAHRSN
jgi:T-complex protein 1 subunit zeta